MSPFLSSEWFLATRQITESMDQYPPEHLLGLIMNVTVNSTEPRQLHLNNGHFYDGHSEEASVELTMDEALAYELFVVNNREAGMAAFMSGQLEVDGHMGHLIAYQSATATAAQAEVHRKIEQITQG